MGTCMVEQRREAAVPRLLGYVIGQRRKAVVPRLLWVRGGTEKEGCCT